jgi:signal transduction histidine kinase
VKRSIRIRLIVWIMALLVPASVAAGWLLVGVFGGRLLRDIDVALEEEAETVASLLLKSLTPGDVQDLLDHVSAETDLGAGKHIVVVQGGTVIDESPAGARSLLTSGDPTLRVVTRRGGPRENPLTVSIAVPATAALKARRRLALLLGIGIPLALLVVAAGLFVVTGRALRPLERAAQQIERIDFDGLGVRITVEDAQDEIGRVLVMLNRMLERLERAVAELRRFTADAAHELRTPLTVLRTALEVSLARERSAVEYREALNEALGSTNRICRLAEDLLTLARLEAVERSPAVEEIDLGEVLQELAEAWREPGSQQQVSIRVDACENARIVGDPGHLYRLFNNLIDNAVRHSPPGGSVGLRVLADGTFWHITVSDEGPGVPEAELEQIFDRFHRGGTERHDHAGSGLGLSIAREIVRTYEGSIQAENLPAGGFSIAVRLPVGSPPRCDRTTV